MSDIERMTITLPAEMAALVKGAVETGDYASTSEVIRSALRGWKHKRAVQQQAFLEMKAEIQKGIDDIEAGRVHDYSMEDIIARGKERLAKRSTLK